MLDSRLSLALLLIGLLTLGCSRAASVPGDPVSTETCSIVLTEVGDREVEVIKAIRAITGVGLREAKELADSTPSVIRTGLSLEEARQIAAQLENVGARVERTHGPAGDRFQGERDRLVRQLAADGIQSEAVLAALRVVPRHRLVPPEQEREAYDDRPLPIGHEQTISQPFIVARMTEWLRVGPGSRVLEVGTGSGYQAAVLAEMGCEVYTIEILAELAERASKSLIDLGHSRVHTRCGDGYQGWPEAAPFDGIVVTAAPDHVPQPLLDQLADGGRLVIPVGKEHAVQELLCFTRRGEEILQESVELVRFVPMTGEARQRKR